MLRTLRPFLHELIENEGYYAEPFLGGGPVAVDVARANPSIQLRLNDKDPLIADLFRVICDKQKSEALCQRLRTQVPSVTLYRALKATDYTDSVDNAFKCLFLNRTSFNGMIHHASPIGGYDQTGKYSFTSEYKPERLIQIIKEWHRLLLVVHRSFAWTPTTSLCNTWTILCSWTRPTSRLPKATNFTVFR